MEPKNEAQRLNAHMERKHPDIPQEILILDFSGFEALNLQ